MNAVGRTINTRFDLDKTYRSTREIMKVAADFVSTNSEQNDSESALQMVRPNPDIADIASRHDGRKVPEIPGGVAIKGAITS